MRCSLTLEELRTHAARTRERLAAAEQRSSKSAAGSAAYLRGNLARTEFLIAEAEAGRLSCGLETAA